MFLLHSNANKSIRFSFTANNTRRVRVKGHAAKERPGVDYWELYMLFLTLTAVKRLMREALELSDPTSQYYAQPLEVTFTNCNQLKNMQ